MGVQTSKGDTRSGGQADLPLIVGVGASAGGLEAVQAFLQGVPKGTGPAIVVVFHLDPTARSLLPEVLDKYTELPVAEVAEGAVAEADHVYTAPAQNIVTLDGGRFRLAPLETVRERRTPIDRTLQSIAEDAGERGVAVILSGVGSDGALGLKAISDAGGVTFVQEPSTAKYDGMPQSAIATGAADHVLPPEALAAELLAYAAHVRDAGIRNAEGGLRRQVEDALPSVCDILLHASGHNFKHYKTSTLVRRVLRRVQVLRLPSARDYLERLRDNKTEAEQLFNDLLIGVTAFFRDGESFDVLAREVIPKLFQQRSLDQPVRIWCAGCATGEEAYSVGMLVCEQFDRLDGPPPDVQIFATDIDEEALAFARQGVYPIGIADEVGPERLKRFFIKKGQHYHITKELRERVLFSVHNVINDPPFSRLDLISCRNLLIYLGSHLQMKLVPLFHYALRPGGYLFLGPSENLSSHRELFRPVDAKHRISQRLPTVIRAPGLLPGRSGPLTPVRPPNVPSANENDAYLLMQRIILDEFAPKAVVVNEEGKIVSASGNLEKYLTVSAGAFHNSLTRLARDGLSVGVRATLAEAAKVRRKVVDDGLSLRTDQGVQRVMVTVQPMPQLGEETGLFLVAFQDVGLPIGEGGAERVPLAADVSALIEQLERELSTTRNDLERTVQDLEAANEELKSGNEELLSMNEELQSANEELETSKEEVQAANDSLGRINTDLENLLASTQIATLFLDRQANLRWVTPAAASVYRVRPEDAGRPLADFTHKAKVMPPLPSFEEVSAATKPIEDSVDLLDGAHLLRRVLPYRNRAGEPEGVVVTFTDVTERRRAEEDLRASEREFRAVFETASVGKAQAELVTGRHLRVNAAYCAIFGYSRDELLSCTNSDITHPDDRDSHRERFERLSRGEIDSFMTEKRFIRKDGRVIWVQVDANLIRDAAGRPQRASAVVQDVTERKEAEAAIARLAAIVESSVDAIASKTLEGIITSWNAAAERMFGYTAAEMIGQSVLKLIPPELHAEEDRILARLRAGQRVEHFETVRVAKDGRRLAVSLSISPIRNGGGKVTGASKIVRDISDRVETEEALRRTEQRFRGLMEQAPFSIQIFAPDGRTVSVNRAWEELWGLNLEKLGEYNVLEDPQLEAKGVAAFLRRAFAGETVEIPVIAYDPEETIPGRTHHAEPVRHVAAVAYPLKDDAGCVREVVLVHEDVTARERAESAIRVSEERLRLALDAGRMGVWDWDLRTDRFEWSDSFEPMHGLERGSFAGTPEAFLSLIHPEDRELVRAAIRQALEGDSGYDMEFRVVWPNGEIRWMAGKGKVFSEAGRPVRMIGFRLDVTDRKRAEQDTRFLADASATLAALVDYQSTLQKVARLAVPHFADWCAVDMLDENGGLQRVAVAHVDPSKVQLAHELYQHTPPNPAAPTGVWNIIRTAKSELIGHITDELLERSVEDPERLRIIRELGLRSYMGVPLTAFGKMLGVITFIAAESGRRYDDDDLAVAEDLAHRAAVAIENARLYLEVREADRRKDEFLSILAHELRNPLAPIRNALEIFKLAGGDAASLVQAREMAERQVHALTRMVDDLLDVSRIMRGKIELRSERVELATVIARAVETARPMLDADGHRLVVALPNEPVWIIADVVRMAQIVSNLLANAAKYSDPGAEVRLLAAREGDGAVVRVRDQGIGIAPEDLGSVFDLFVQVDAAGQRAQGGLGIGLTVVRDLVAMHGGTVEAHSEGLGKGSEFVVHLPPAPADDSASTLETPAPRTRQIRPRRILVVDDHVDAAESLALLLRLEGHDVRVAHGGIEALRLAETDPPEVAFFDLGMPHMDGHELAGRFRAHPALKNVRLVALTGWGQQEVRRRTKEAGFDHHLVKPPEPAALDAFFAELDDA